MAAVDAHTLYAAADALALTQSAVTKRVAALERRVGQRLLERGRTGVRPTAAGRALYPEARAALAALERARRAVADPGAGAALAVAASHTVAGYLLPGWLAGSGRSAARCGSRSRSSTRRGCSPQSARGGPSSGSSRASTRSTASSRRCC